MSGGDKPHETPYIAKMPSESDWGKKSGSGVLVSDEAQWAARASAADEAIASLQASLKGVRTVVNTNYFGENCQEGKALYEGLRSILGEQGWTSAINRQIEALKQISLNCHAAGRTFVNEDATSSNEMQN